ncbi:MAG: hypothetical protein K2F99_07780 [Muribaculaceae bacterium]|nr:hypothetical protein [Muribaculaceae bacterium]
MRCKRGYANPLPPRRLRSGYGLEICDRGSSVSSIEAIEMMLNGKPGRRKGVAV